MCLDLDLTPPQADDEYMLSDYDLFVNQFISVPKDMGQLNCAAFIAGVLKGALHGAGFPARHLTSLAQSFAARILGIQGAILIVAAGSQLISCQSKAKPGLRQPS